jgi:phosphohistidine phosphatase
MAKQLLLIRHAEAETPYLGQRDFDRELTSHGIITTSVTGKKLKELGFKPDYIFSSAANRAKTTAILLAEQVGYEVDNIILSEEIYNCSLNILLEYVNKIDNQFQQVIMVNHNPNISYLAEYLTGADMQDGMNPIGIANLSFDLEDWKMVGQHTGKLLWYKDLYRG